MANLIFPIINPFRLHLSDTVIDYIDTLPSQDRMYLRNDYQRGIYSTDDLYPVFALNNVLSFQLTSNYGEDVEVFLRDISTNTRYNFSEDDVNSITINSNTIYTIEKEMTLEGIFKVEIEINTDSNTKIYSDEFKVCDWATTKDLVKIEFSDSRNRCGGYFYKSDGTVVWNPIAYYTGNIVVTDPETEDSVHDGDNGGTTKLESTSKRCSILTISDISNKYVDVIRAQCDCDTFLANGIEYTTSDFSREDQPNSDLVDLKIKIIQKYNSYNVNY